MKQNLDWIWTSSKLPLLAKANFKRYIATLYKLVIEDNTKFDIIISGGNTGMIMGRWAQLFFDVAKVERPIFITTTPQRFKPSKKNGDQNRLDNSVLNLDIQNQFYNYNITPKNTENILFVDDEISRGLTADICIESLKKVFGNKPLNYYIVAEDQGYIPNKYGANIETHFIPFAKEIEGLNNIVIYLTPNDIYQKVKNAISVESDRDKYIVNVLMDLPSRNKGILFDGYDYKFNYEVANSVSDIQNLKREFSKYVNNLIADAILEYKNGKIDLKNNEYIREFLVKD